VRGGYELAQERSHAATVKRGQDIGGNSIKTTQRSEDVEKKDPGNAGPTIQDTKVLVQGSGKKLPNE